MRFRFHPEAEAELNDAVDYYDESQEGLGLEFAKEVHSAIESIHEFPLALGSSFSEHSETSSKALPLRGGLSAPR